MICYIIFRVLNDKNLLQIYSKNIFILYFYSHPFYICLYHVTLTRHRVKRMLPIFTKILYKLIFSKTCDILQQLKKANIC